MTGSMGASAWEALEWKALEQGLWNSAGIWVVCGLETLLPSLAAFPLRGGSVFGLEEMRGPLGNRSRSWPGKKPALSLHLSTDGRVGLGWRLWLPHWPAFNRCLLPGTGDANPAVSEDALFRDKLKHMGKCESLSGPDALPAFLRQALWPPSGEGAPQNVSHN
ncbi:hypothetical protein P7K49_011366 [Saguinus oedipus]|uniref:Uncharacterized protein n=1 Tax=Saguinus oedipus TaxID=9490 RepID=A0ABQ9VQF2_SAGOE|nr:hypothetical protein P7K49_011366 [Saguinus oedipus]